MSTDSILRNGVFRRLFAAQIVALIGTGLLTVALGLLAYDVAGSAAGSVLGTALAIKMIAYVSVAPVVSTLTDRLPRKVVLVCADAVRASVALALPFVDQVWHVYVLIFVLQAASATFTPTFQGVIPAVVPDVNQYTRALSLSRIAYDLEALFSPVLAALLLTVISYSALFAATALGFVLSAAFVIGARIPVRRSDPPGRFFRRMTLSTSIFRRSSDLRGLLAANLVVASATALVMVNTVVYVHDILGGTASAVAVGFACYGGGSMAFALLAPRVIARVTDVSVMAAGCQLACTTLVGVAAFVAVGPGGMLGWVVLGALWVALGAATSMVNTPSARLLRRQSDDATRPQVFAAQFSLSHACFLLTYPVAGWIGAELDQFTAVVVLAVLATLATIAARNQWQRQPRENRHGSSDAVAGPTDDPRLGGPEPLAGPERLVDPHAADPEPLAESDASRHPGRRAAVGSR